MTNNITITKDKTTATIHAEFSVDSYDYIKKSVEDFNTFLALNHPNYQYIDGVKDAKKVLDQLINALNTQYRDLDPNAKPLIGKHGYLEK